MSLDDRLAFYLRAFLTNPDQMVQMPAGEAVELCRAGRDFEVMLGLAATSDAARLEAAEHYLRAVEGEAAGGIADAVGALRERHAAAREVEESQGVDPPTPLPDPRVLAAIHERIFVPRERILERQRDTARRMGSDS